MRLLKYGLDMSLTLNYPLFPLSIFDRARKYRYMELNLNQRKTALEEKIPDIKKSLGVVEFMIAKVSRVSFNVQTPI